MGKRIFYTCDFCGSAIDLDKQVGILDYCSAVRAMDERWELNERKYNVINVSEKFHYF